MSNPNTPRGRLSRRAFMRTLLYGTGGASLAALGATVYAARLEPAWLTLERLMIPIRNLPPAFDGYRLVQLSDIHVFDTVPRETADRAVRLALDLAPNLIVLTGDYVTGFVNAPLVLGALEPLTAPDGVWGILGNHDHWVDAAGVRQVLAGAGVRELRNANTAIERGGSRLWLAGVDDIWEQQHDLGAALAGIPDGAPTILLAHEPDYADEVFPTGRVSLQLSGHSHGGQVRVPFFGPPILPYLGEKYPYGLRKLGEMWLYTNRGVGWLTQVRFNCRPEVTEITLTRA